MSRQSGTIPGLSQGRLWLAGVIVLLGCLREAMGEGSRPAPVESLTPVMSRPMFAVVSQAIEKAKPSSVSKGAGLAASEQNTEAIPEAPWVPPPVCGSGVGASEPAGQSSADRCCSEPESTFCYPLERGFRFELGLEGMGRLEERQEGWVPFLPPSPLPVHWVDKAERGWAGHSDGLKTPQDLEDPKFGGWRFASTGQGLGLSTDRWMDGEGPREYRRSIQLERIAREADQHTRRGFELAGRRAYFSARAEFITALRLVAEGLDKEYRTHLHSQAMVRGLTALEEADDFLSPAGGVKGAWDLPTIIMGHTTPVFPGGGWEYLTVMEVLQKYFTYAQEQLALAGGQEVAGSMALHGLGKLYAAIAEQPALGLKDAQAKAMVFYQAALLVDPYNFMAANDLGVLLARSGWYEEARNVLSYSLRIRSHAVGWRNLAIVYRQMGQYELALQAAQQWRQLRRQEQEAAQDQAHSAGLAVQWVPPEHFAASRANSVTVPTGFPQVDPAQIDRTEANRNVSSSRPKRGTSQPGEADHSHFPDKSQSGDNKAGSFFSSLFRGPLALFQKEGSIIGHGQTPPMSGRSAGEEEMGTGRGRLSHSEKLPVR